MYFSKLLSMIRSYLWLLVLATLVAGLAALFILRRQPAVYEAKTQLLVGPSLQSASPDLNSLRIGGQLIQTYAELVDTRPFLNSVNSKLEQKTDLGSLEGMIEIRQNVDTRILTIVVHHKDPQQAMSVANATADSLVEISPSKDNTTALLRSQMGEQSQQLEQIINNAEIAIQELEAELLALGNVIPRTPQETQAVLDQQNLVVRQLTEERARMSDALRTQTTIYQVLLDTNTNQVEIIELAETAIPVDQNIPLRAAASAMAGLIFAVMIIFAIETFDNTIRVPEDLSGGVNKAPLLGTIDRHPRLAGSGLARVVVFAQPQSRAANSYRTVVARLLHSIGESMPYRVLLSSVGSQSGDAAATTAMNLAVAFAQAGRQVVLVDAQFQNPVLTRVFETGDKAGLSDVLVTSLATPPLLPVKEMPGIRFMPVGLAAEKGAGTALDSAKVTRLLTELQQDADIVLIAASPIPSFAESLALASQVNGLIVVAQHGESGKTTFASVAESLQDMNVHLLGAIFDHNPSRFVSRQTSIMKYWQTITTTLRGKRNKISEQTVEG